MVAQALALILLVEGSPDNFVSKSGAIGRYQIKPAVVEDVNRRYGTRFMAADMHNPRRARHVAEMHLEALRARRPQADMCWLVRAWSQGARGADEHRGYWYWKRVAGRK